MKIHIHIQHLFEPKKQQNMCIHMYYVCTLYYESSGQPKRSVRHRTQLIVDGLIIDDKIVNFKPHTSTYYMYKLYVYQPVPNFLMCQDKNKLVQANEYHNYNIPVQNLIQNKIKYFFYSAAVATVLHGEPVGQRRSGGEGAGTCHPNP